MYSIRKAKINNFDFRYNFHPSRPLNIEVANKVKGAYLTIADFLDNADRFEEIENYRLELVRTVEFKTYDLRDCKRYGEEYDGEEKTIAGDIAALEKEIADIKEVQDKLGRRCRVGLSINDRAIFINKDIFISEDSGQPRLFVYDDYYGCMDCVAPFKDIAGVRNDLLARAKQYNNGELIWGV